MKTKKESINLILHKDYGQRITLFSEKTLTSRETSILYTIIKYTSPYSKNSEFNNKKLVLNNNTDDIKKYLLNCFDNEIMLKGTIPFYSLKPFFKNPNDIYKKEFWKSLLKFSHIQTYNIGNNVKNPFIYNLFSLIEKGEAIDGSKGIKFEMNYKFVGILINENEKFYKLDILKTKNLTWYETQLMIFIENKHGVGKNKKTNIFNYKINKNNFKDMIGMTIKQYKDTQNFQKLLFKMKKNINKYYKTIKINELTLIKENINSKIKNIVSFNGTITRINKNKEFNNVIKNNNLDYSTNNIIKNDNPQKKYKNVDEIIIKLKIQKDKLTKKISALNNNLSKWKDYNKENKLLHYNNQIKTINEINKIFKESPNKLFVNNDNELGCFYIDDDKKKEKGEYHLTDIDNIRWIS